MMRRAIYRSAEGRRRVLDAYDRVLERWPIALKTFRLPTELGETFGLECGREGDPPLVLLHGAATNSGLWIGEIERFARHHRVFAIDLPGEPGRSSERRQPWRDAGHATWLRDVLDGLGLEKASLLGSSLGGWVGLLTAASAPARVSSLVVLSPGGVTRDSLGFALKAGLNQMLGEAGRARVRRMVFGTEAVPAALDAYLALIMREFRPRMEPLPLFSDDQLRRLTMPTLVLVGADDGLRMAAPLLDRVRRLVPAAVAEVVPGAHALTCCFDRVERFLSEVAPVAVS